MGPGYDEHIQVKQKTSLIGCGTVSEFDNRGITNTHEGREDHDGHHLLGQP